MTSPGDRPEDGASAAPPPPAPPRPPGGKPPWGDAFALDERGPSAPPDRITAEPAAPSPTPVPTLMPPEPVGDVSHARAPEPVADRPAPAGPADVASVSGDDRWRDPRVLVTGAVLLVVLLSIGGWLLLRGGPAADVRDAPYAGDLGLLNDLRVIERRAGQELAREGLPTVGDSDVAGDVARCTAVRRVERGDDAPLRLAASVRTAGTDALVLVSGAAGEVLLEVVDAADCSPVNPPRSPL